MTGNEILLSIINTLALTIVAIVGWGVRRTMDQAEKHQDHLEAVIDRVATALHEIQVTMGELRAAFIAHAELDDVRFKEIQRRLDT